MSAGTVYRLIWERLTSVQRRWFLGICLLAITNSLIEIVSLATSAVFASALLVSDSFLGRNRLRALLQAAGWAEPTPRDLLVAAGTLALGALLVRGLFALTKTFLDARYTSWCFASLSRRAFEELLRRPYRWHVERNSAVLLKAVQDDMWQVHLLILQAVNIISDSLLLGFLLAAMGARTGPLVLVSFGALGALAYALHRLINRRLRRWATEEHAANLSAARYAAQGLHGIKDLQVLGREAVLLERFSESRQQLQRLRGWTELLRNAPRFLMELLAFLGLVGLVTLSQASQPQLASTLTWLALSLLRLLPAINRLLLNLATVTGLLPGASHALELFAPYQPIQPSPTDERIESVELQGITLRYAGSAEPALQAVDLTVRRGHKLGLVGASGGGKTTLADVLCGLLEPDQGSIRVNGHEVGAGGLKSRYPGRVGYVLQDPFLLDASIAQNVAFRLEGVDQERVWRCLEMAQLDGFVRELEQGLASPVGERGVRLSGGQAQRLAIARSLYNDPDILILDEATSALDNLTEAAFLTTLEPLSQRLALVIIAHRMTTVRACDSIVLLERGRVVAQGSHVQLMEGCPAYQALVNSVPA